MLFSLFVSAVECATGATYYFRVGAQPSQCLSVPDLNDGRRYGPCNGGTQYGGNSRYWAAVANGAAHCGQQITMTYGSRSIQLTVMDICEACRNDGHVDMSVEALIELTGSVEHACAINRGLPMVEWSFGAAGPSMPSPEAPRRAAPSQSPSSSPPSFWSAPEPKAPSASPSASPKSSPKWSPPSPTATVSPAAKSPESFPWTPAPKSAKASPSASPATEAPKASAPPAPKASPSASPVAKSPKAPVASPFAEWTQDTKHHWHHHMPAPSPSSSPVSVEVDTWGSKDTPIYSTFQVSAAHLVVPSLLLVAMLL